MVKASRYSVLTAAVACAILTSGAAAADQAHRNLVDVGWVQQHLGDADVLVLDASPTQIYATKHIPGAVSVDLMSWYGVQQPSAAEMEKKYQSWGISPTKKIVMYDQGGTFLATRLLFSLYYHGFPERNLLLLDGGLSKWQEQHLPVTKDASAAPKKGSFTIGRITENAQAALPEFLAASGDPAGNALVEALGPDWHYGEVAPFEKAGHIPNALLLPAADFFNPDSTFKSADEIRKMVAYVGIRSEQQIYTVCGGGVAASVPYFALKFMLNYPKVKLYTESEMGWLRDERDLPYWTYDAPYLIREARWLQFWGGQRIRAFGGAQVSIVDVRPADAFSQGHVPFALNIPADVFKRTLHDPQALAGIVGAAGVDPAHEAVVVSGGGVTPESALAFVALAALGQKKVSVLLAPSSTWAQSGFALKTEPTAVGPSRGPHDLSVAPISYSPNVRTAVVVADRNSTTGLYSKVFVASGRNMPAAVPDGKVVHVPYSDLLNADGTPKAAKDIWNILSKAGVPRYAELICLSDDPGEAAANYFILKLMGYPDVKVLLPPDRPDSAR